LITISKIFEFSACHTLARPDWSEEENNARFGKCANPNGHGHNYRLEVTVGGSLHPETGMLIDTKELQKIVDREVISDLDHKNLNQDVNWLEGKLPTTEILVDEIYKRIESPLKAAASNCRLSKVVLWETRKIFATREEG